MLDCIKDKGGRYILVWGVFQGTAISILNVYYPPSHPSDFVKKVFLDFSEIQSDITNMGGDFNGILNPVIDRLLLKAMPLSRQAKALSSTCEELGLAGVWRMMQRKHTRFALYLITVSAFSCQGRRD